jgi:ATP-dependent exoDNAse (exonuclease V) beta subunit
MTLIIPKYNYASISRESVEGKRLYLCPDGSKVPSVTTILDKTKSAEKIAALQNWKKAVGEVKAQEIVTEAANRGTRMHKFLEDYLLDGELKSSGSNPYSKISHAMAEQVITHGLKHVDEFWGSEVALYYPELYAGTTDCLGVWKGKEAILDFKQTNKPKKREWIEDYFHQLAAYANAHNKMYGTNINTGVILMCAQPKTNAKLEIIEAPQYQEFVVELDEFDKYSNEWWDKVEQFYLQNG